MSPNYRSFKEIMMKYGLYIPIICVVIFTITDSASGNWDNWNRNLLSNLLVIGLGIQMTIFGFNHIFFGDRIAEYIGWPKGSPFQFELGIAAFGVGVLGILCSWYTGLFWLATIICSSIFLWGCAIGHIRDMVKNKNFKPGSAGFVFYWDLLMPPALIILYATY